MRQTKIAIIGAGSASFGLSSLRDAFRQPELVGSTLSLVDIDESALETMTKLARRMNEESGAGMKIESTLERRPALDGAEYVITCFAVERDELWKKDWAIPLKHGIKHVMGENGGPGGLSHSLRNIPILLNIAFDMEELCPDALLVNFSNPESRLCMALLRYTDIAAIGLCHGIHGTMHNLASILGTSAANLDCRAAGLNHFTWIQDLRFKDTGEDAYPLLAEKLLDFDPAFQPLCRYMFDRYGLYPSPGDDHIGEYLSFAWEHVGLNGYDFQSIADNREETWRRIRAMIAGEESVKELLKEGSGERAFAIIAATLSHANQLELAVNIPNDGCVPNISPNAIVEVPAIVSASGIQGLVCEALPDGIAALCNTQVAIQELVVDAAATGDRELALQALLMDPTVQSAQAAERTLDELLTTHAAYLPQFDR